ncbi:MAG: hypothetical protein CEO21_389 [Microgenomates group bacterium Gr01-1014_80]|nr:MAG: hypothetical protein CEO21_389 [Microgenomates group bacterium Gr01-1014_80]
MAVTFPFKEEKSAIFGKIHRPIALVYIKHQKENLWRKVDMIVDSGADYTLLPRFLASALGVSLSRDCMVVDTNGVGGRSKVYLLRKKLLVKIGDYERSIPVGFLSSDYIPPLLGRKEFFETFKVTFEKFIVSFE